MAISLSKNQVPAPHITDQIKSGLNYALAATKNALVPPVRGKRKSELDMERAMEISRNITKKSDDDLVKALENSRNVQKRSSDQDMAIALELSRNEAINIQVAADTSENIDDEELAIQLSRQPPTPEIRIENAELDRMIAIEMSNRERDENFARILQRQEDELEQRERTKSSSRSKRQSCIVM